MLRNDDIGDPERSEAAHCAGANRRCLERYRPATLIKKARQAEINRVGADEDGQRELVETCDGVVQCLPVAGRENIDQGKADGLAALLRDQRRQGSRLSRRTGHQNPPRLQRLAHRLDRHVSSVSAPRARN